MAKRRGIDSIFGRGCDAAPVAHPDPDIRAQIEAAWRGVYAGTPELDMAREAFLPWLNVGFEKMPAD